MLIGLDFDNTIANYEGVFWRAAVERGLIDDSVGKSKNAVRDHLNGRGDKDAFTELQGYVYGSRMDLVSPYEGVAAFCERAVAEGHELAIISHKTRTPIKGPAYDMHDAARGFLSVNSLIGPGKVPDNRVFFEPTKNEKAARISALKVDVFVDDLPEIFALPEFPDSTRRILFDPNNTLIGSHHSGFEPHFSWALITETLLGARSKS